MSDRDRSPTTGEVTVNLTGDGADPAAAQGAARSLASYDLDISQIVNSTQGTLSTVYFGGGAWGRLSDDPSGTLGLSSGAWEQPPPGTTPTLGHVFKQVVAGRADYELGTSRIAESLQRGLQEIRNDVAVVQSKLEERELLSAEPVLPSRQGQVIELRAAVRIVSIYLIVVAIFSLVLWYTSGFALINPAASCIVLTAALFACLVARASRAIER